MCERRSDATQYGDNHRARARARSQSHHTLSAIVVLFIVAHAPTLVLRASTAEKRVDLTDVFTSYAFIPATVTAALPASEAGSVGGPTTALANRSEIAVITQLM